MPRSAWSLPALARTALACFASSGALLCAAVPQDPSDFSLRIWQMEDGLPQNGVTSVLQSHDGYLWIGTYGGLVRFDGVHFTVFNTGNAPKLHNSRITSLFEDERGTLWIGHETGDVTRLANGKFEPLPFPARWQRKAVRAIAADSQGRIWSLNQSGVLANLTNTQTLPPQGGELRSPNSVALIRSPQGALWVVIDGTVSRLRGDHLEPIQAIRSAQGGYVSGAGPSRDGGLWLAIDGRFRKWLDGRWVEDWGACPWGQSPVSIVVERRNGSLAVGTLDQGLFLLFPGREFRQFHRVNGLPQDWVRCLSEDREGNLWFGAGSGGVVALRPAPIANLNAPDHWEGRAVLSVTQDQDGALWAGTEGAGLYRYLAGQWSHFTETHGLSNLFVWSVTQDAQGRLWAGTWGGGLLTRVGDHFERAPGLEGLESEWVDAGTRRAAFYSLLPPGDYTFRVTASNPDGHWNPESAMQSFTVLPFFWQTWWFQSLAATTAVSLAGLSVLYAVRSRMRHHLVQAERQRSIERERARIAQDIHDELGAGLTRITLLSQSARADMDRSLQAASDLDRIYLTARELTRAMDEIVWAVNPRHDTLDSLVTYLGRFAQDFLGPAGVRCRLDLPVSLPAWPVTAELRHHLFLAFKETLHNTIKHAAASEVRISLTLHPAAFALAVSDNGRGLPPNGSPLNPSVAPDRLTPGQGLANLQQRLAVLGGRCELESLAGAGTCIRFVCPRTSG